MFCEKFFSAITMRYDSHLNRKFCLSRSHPRISRNIEINFVRDLARHIQTTNLFYASLGVNKNERSCLGTNGFRKVMCERNKEKEITAKVVYCKGILP